MFKNKILLITGGTGSFGEAVVKKMISSEIKEIRIFSRDEKKQYDMRRKFDNPKLKFYLGDIRNFESINSALKGVDYVFHAAALKQVPSGEYYPMEAIMTNTMGAQNVINASIQNRVTKAILLSTDKAVYPINAMGMTKALMEKLMIANSRNLVEDETILCGTRYGNVMASRGSVIPLFVKQIKEGTPITITDPNMTRFLMSLDEAVDLVLYAFDNGNQGDLFVQKAPAATTLDIAIALKEIFNVNNDIEIIGTRAGEKLYETLVTREEMSKSIETKQFYKIPLENKEITYKEFFSQGKENISNLEDYNSHNTERLGIEELKKLFLSLNYIQKEL